MTNKLSQHLRSSPSEKARMWEAYYGDSIFNDNQNNKFWVSEIIRKGDK